MTRFRYTRGREFSVLRVLSPLRLLILTLFVALLGGVAPAEQDDVVNWSPWLQDAEVWRVDEIPTPDEPALFSEAQPTPPVLRPLAANKSKRPGRVIRYEARLDDHAAHTAFAAHGVQGEVIASPVKAGSKEDSTISKYSARMAAFFVGEEATPGPDEVLLVRYDAPAEEITLHAELTHLNGQVLDTGALLLPEVRFFQPKARVYMDLKRSNDEQFDLFTDGSFLASLDVVELYFPMPLVSERFARTFGRRSRLSGLGWRMGATIGLGVTTALTEGESKASGSPISTLSAGVRYEFPLGPASEEVLATGDWRLDRRTRVGIEGGVQGGLSADESINDSTDIGLYFGILVNTPWGG